MVDITIIIKEAASHDVLWSVSDFYIALEQLAHRGYKVSFWQGEENWAQIIHADTVVGYVWRKYPLIFTLVKHTNSVRAALPPQYPVSYIETEDLSNKIFSISRSEVEHLLDEGIDATRFSAEDLWFFTNSI